MDQREETELREAASAPRKPKPTHKPGKTCKARTLLQGPEEHSTVLALGTPMGWVGAGLDPEPRTVHPGFPQQLAQRAAGDGGSPMWAPAPSPALLPHSPQQTDAGNQWAPAALPVPSLRQSIKASA